MGSEENSEREARAEDRGASRDACLAPHATPRAMALNAEISLVGKLAAVKRRLLQVRLLLSALLSKRPR